MYMYLTDMMFLSVFSIHSDNFGEALTFAEVSKHTLRLYTYTYAIATATYVCSNQSMQVPSNILYMYVCV